MSPARDPYPYFLAWEERFGRNPAAFFLDSFRSSGDARYSYFPLGPPEKIISAFTRKDFPKAWADLQKELKDGGRARRPGPPFQGGAVGILSYDAGRLFERAWRTRQPRDPLGFPLLYFGIFRDLAAFDHKRERFYLFASGTRRLHQLKERFEGLNAGSHREGRFIGPKRSRPRDCFVGDLRSPPRNDTLEDWYVRTAGRIKDYIAKGDIYQANISQRMERASRESGADYFARLRRINPSPYACYFRIPSREGRPAFEVASCSPELLLRKRGKWMETRPIAGTRPRGKTRNEDRKLKGELLLSPKERAEHVMLLDLERNDLGRVCRAGSVTVEKKMGVERYSHVMHIVSRVRGKLKRGEDFFSALSSVFPGGTITGCPKVRCLQILDELEPCARGPFYGSAGWAGFSGDGEMNLLIRTAVIGGGRLAIQVGSGIVADSDPRKEYEESLQKGAALLSALAPPVVNNC